MTRRTKIVCTLGPASTDPKVLARMIEAGMDVVRINFSHGTSQEHAKRVEMIRSLARSAGRTIGVLMDLQGPKIRIGKFDVPEPMRVAPELGSQYWVVELSAALLGKSYRWDGDGVDLCHLSQGICHTTHEAAELHGRALLSLTAEGDKND